MRLVPHSKDLYHRVVLLLIAIIGSMSIIFAVFIARWTCGRSLDDLGGVSQTVASTLDSDEVLLLDGSKDADSVHQELQGKLRSLKQINHIDRGVYLLGRHSDNSVFLYASSERTDSSSQLKDLYNGDTGKLKVVFQDGRPFVDAPGLHATGGDIAAAAPVFQADSQKVLAVVGVSMSANTYRESALLSASVPLLVGFTFITLMVLFENARRRKQQLLTMRSELVSVASHELRTPITGIRWAAESLEQLNENKQAAALIKSIYRSASNLQASTDDILELTHAMKEQKPQRKQVNLAALMQEVVETQQLAAQQKGVSLFYDLSWPKTLNAYCDEAKMKRVFHNLVSNAIKYTNPDTVITLSYDATPKSHIIHITDQGIGIPKGEQSKIFAGYYRASNAIASKVDGTGLGLYLVRVVVQQHGGNVSFFSEENKGTTFTISLPKK